HFLAQVERTDSSGGFVLFGQHWIVSILPGDLNFPTRGNLFGHLCPVHLYHVGLLPDDLSRWSFCSAVEHTLAGALDAEDHLLFYPRTIHDHVVATCTQCNLRDCELRRDHRFDDLSLHTRLESLATTAGKVAPFWLRWNVCADHTV